MSSGDQATLYIPAEDEPSIFSEHNNGIPIEWPSWYLHKKEAGEGRTIMLYPLRTPSYELLEKARALRLRLREELYGFDVELPPEPPSLYAKGSDYISLRWVLDTARRERMSPEEAMLLGMALRKM